MGVPWSSNAPTAWASATLRDWVLALGGCEESQRENPRLANVHLIRADAHGTCGTDARTALPERPRAIVIEVGDRGNEGHIALEKLREAGLLGTVPMLVTGTLEAVKTIEDEHVDDFVIVPYERAELDERIRRAERRHGLPRPGTTLQQGIIAIDRAGHEVTVSGEIVALTKLEYRLLVFLLENPGRVLSRQELLVNVWGAERNQRSRTVDTHVRRLRHKLERADFPLETVRGVGYKFRP